MSKQWNIETVMARVKEYYGEILALALTEKDLSYLCSNGDILPINAPLIPESWFANCRVRGFKADVVSVYGWNLNSTNEMLLFKPKRGIDIIHGFDNVFENGIQLPVGSNPDDISFCKSNWGTTAGDITNRKSIIIDGDLEVDFLNTMKTDRYYLYVDILNDMTERLKQLNLSNFSEELIHDRFAKIFIRVFVGTCKKKKDNIWRSNVSLCMSMNDPLLFWKDIIYENSLGVEDKS